MPALELPRRHLGALHALATRLLDARKAGTPLESLARALLGGFHDLCIRAGLDGVLAELAAAHPPLDPADRDALVEHPTLVPALTARLEGIRLDAGGPRNARPGQVAECVTGALGVAVVGDADGAITLDDAVRTEVAAALVRAVAPVLGVPAFRDAIIAEGRERCEERYRAAFGKMAAKLDERGMKLLEQPKLPIDAVQAVQRVLFDTRHEIVERAARAAIDGARDAIARTDAGAAARIDQPITLKLTPRDVAIVRACDASTPKNPEAIAASLLDSLTSLARLAWRAPVRIARPYSPKETFAVGELLAHPKFGQGSVVASKLGKIEVEFPDGKITLVHKG
jgi:hypothetical protein